MKLTQKQRDNRYNARYSGKAAMANIRMALSCQEAADGWMRIADQCERRYGKDDTSTIEARQRAAAQAKIADHQTDQAYINTQRAVRHAVKSEQPNY